ncbi:similar to Saccharomyces cerevisiae YDR493W MZM1 Mitochondrial matrix protein with a role in maintaining the labile mitochondrial zinc pool [Maudiozyma barnettii]|uniref:Mitochondrial zinc maintenance protein 1, mitochondrial n=1 Tax=Maudiozyma barnettii TaxID=61262 RepID=A0A8H2VEG7_9SACH|nr:Mzm1p [Kazachstania barnettii]CAB4253594.1 similar to Saccharomyces cerevisiae YDR493W MZM1 Mitochondrial matrix protein with a role in maintaining the labile mitochondrial zinc pool [Kazachstania barnettii]CAD1781268.1 similar to Saccharomyces cerevisiae YDR493W MZM1 Mitochondrial matrix protein with a role in maintaining the labile mitochondrial zinc pool [Kazachstania barnettii]
MSTNLTRQALTAYRHGLRATRVAFNEDTRLLLAARQKMRQGMLAPENPDIPIEKQIKLMEDVAQFLRKNIVQGKRVETTSSNEKPTYHLNLHKDTELGDNDEIKNISKRNTLTSGATSGGGCCGGSGKAH